MTKVILASASSSRLKVLRQAGLDPAVVVSGVDEDAFSAGTPAELAGVLAVAKAKTVAAELEDGLVIGCDSLLEFDGKAYGKAGSAEEAAQRWRSYAGESGILHSGHCVIDAGSGRSASAVSSTVVHFGRPADQEILAFAATDEARQTAGSFTIDGKCGFFVEWIEGDHGTVLGLSLPTLRRLFQNLGVEVTALWR